MTPDATLTLDVDTHRVDEACWRLSDTLRRVASALEPQDCEAEEDCEEFSTENDVCASEPALHHLRLDEAFALDDAGLAISDAGSLLAAKHTACSMNSGVERSLSFGTIDAFEDDGYLAHGSSDEAALAGECRRGSLAADPQLLSVVLFQPGEVVVIVDLLLDGCSQQLRDT